ncbi:methylated-DNA--[protein]-cysteine S-methyltransferase [Neobacillus sp. PS3-40]|uniref:methylated-DNA--[protein]-cysteine S-methyltransferase n=1 Tax=Neobacillus sp. PS3-40 TaxID=3070679 RepID=UPI0027DFFA65|nr:methylated-DNA--[protein]-cysteine S-methyltransferase [Neobacillus sp. PS3-40]WML42866.1 methylated-DNA--[protein]-cysteine S-methyltransferase [Neobacillus sp. PS3-40]
MTDKYYGYYESSVGLIEVVCTKEWVLSVLFVDKRATTTDSTDLLEEALLQLEQFFKGMRKEFTLPLSLNGTEFQKGVWQELLNIPFGQTLSYKDLAVKIGNEKATRAVGNANSKNLIGIIVPCHRVIGSNQSLTGYSGGLERKQWLLAHERKCL